MGTCMARDIRHPTAYLVPRFRTFGLMACMHHILRTNSYRSEICTVLPLLRTKVASRWRRLLFFLLFRYTMRASLKGANLGAYTAQSTTTL
jgi:hypothetical protein